ncbi:MAG TPA: HlyD family efflux transporter periplasmic adaptor subunit [Blastocatellia bacterium]|nr:HlyD family efflux transporter periplasmic adaptor subunit [Blastocatellia bacterium]
MDVPRAKSVARNKKIKRIVYVILALAAIGGASVALSRLKPAAPRVEWGTVWPGEVNRGDIPRNVKGIGTLVPEEIRLIPATTNGRIEKRHVKPGANVKADTIIIEMSNPELERDALDALNQLKGAEAELANQKVQLQSNRLNQQSQAATVASDYQRAKLQAERDEVLAKEGLSSDLNAKLSRGQADALANRDKIEKERLNIVDDAIKAQVQVYEARVQQFKALYELRRSQLDALKVRAGVNGVVQEVPIQEGQQVTQGTILARVIDPTALKAEVRVAETQTKDIVVGQRAEIDTRNGIIDGRVMRIAPTAQQGTVTVEVELLSELPKGARPDLSVDGTIELELMKNVVYMPRPAFGQANSQITLFKLLPDGKEAVRVPVKLGRDSVSFIEVLEGLNVGDQVILSDTSQYDSVNRIRLNR